MSKTPATHYGECQICGHQQKLPRGVLSKHGYTKQWGFFSGTCPGAGHLPFEQSMALIPPRIEAAKKGAKNLRAQAKAKVLEKDFNVRWTVYPSDLKMDSWTFAGKFGRHARNTEIDGVLVGTSKEVRSGDDKWTSHYVWVDFKYDGKSFRKDANAYGKTVEEVRDIYKKREADQLLFLAVQHDDYVKWQGERIKDWKEKPLKPVA